MTFTSFLVLLVLDAAAQQRLSAFQKIPPCNYGLLPRSPVAPMPMNTLPPVPQSFASPWDYRSLGLFCKADVQFRRLLPIPLLIRLDDVQRVEGMEGKGPLAPLR